MANGGAARGQHDKTVDRAVRLFQFLARSQQLKSKPARTTDSYESVLWFGRLPEHPAVRSAHRDTVFEAGGSLLSVERVAHQNPPSRTPR